jgi:glycosyltransferase involved in cell wall biosynthesis
MFRFPLLCRMLRHKIINYHADEVVISSFAAVKNIVTPHPHGPATKRPVSIALKVSLYLHSPMQYVWENYDENIKKLQFPIKQFYMRATRYLRPWDLRERHYDTVCANSEYTAALAKKLYVIDAAILYPALDPIYFTTPAASSPKNYFVFVGRVQRYVREIDTIIALMNASGEHLLVIGDGPDMAYAQSIAGPTITFLGQINDVTEKMRIVREARGCINLAKESFGLGTAEALCLGVPVFGYA